MFKETVSQLKKAGVDFLRGDLANPIAAKIRGGYNTRFLKATRTPEAVTTKLIGLKDAIKTLENPVHSRKSFSVIQATTKIRKRVK